MADISRLSRLLNGVPRGVDLSANTLVVSSIKLGVGETELTQAILDKLVAMQGVARADGKYDADNVVVAGTAANHSPASADVEAWLASLDTALASAGGTDFADDTFRISDNTDSSKKIAFEGSAITTSTLRTITMPDADVDLGDIATNTSAASAAQGDATQALSDAAAAQSTADAAIPSTEKAANNGVATLDAGGKVPASQLPNSVMEYKGNWAASTNTPSLADGAGNAGDVYIASDAGTVDFGAGNITFSAGDWVVYSGSIWEKSVNSNSVASVNGQTGAVSLDTDDVLEGSANLYFTDARVDAALGSVGGFTGSWVSSPTIAASGSFEFQAAEFVVQKEDVVAGDGSYFDFYHATSGTESFELYGEIQAAQTALTLNARKSITAFGGVTTIGKTGESYAEIHSRNKTGQNSIIRTGWLGIELETPADAAADADSTLPVTITTGNKTAGTGDSGSISLETGTSVGGSRGSIQFKDGSEGTAGKVLISKDANGSMEWGDISSIRDTKTAGEAFTAAGGPYAVRYGVTDLDTPETAGRIYKADPTELSLVKTGGNKDPFHAIGVAAPGADVSAAGDIEVITHGKMTITAHGLSIGEPIYLDSSGALTSTAPTASGEAVVRIGMAEDANTIFVSTSVVAVN